MWDGHGQSSPIVCDTFEPARCCFVRPVSYWRLFLTAVGCNDRVVKGARCFLSSLAVKNRDVTGRNKPCRIKFRRFNHITIPPRLLVARAREQLLSVLHSWGGGTPKPSVISVFVSCAICCCVTRLSPPSLSTCGTSGAWCTS